MAKRGKRPNLFQRAYAGRNNREVDTIASAKWRKKVLARDKYTCQLCNKKRSRNSLHAHHIRRWADCPTIRYDPDNGVALCPPCHKSIKDREGDYAAFFMSKIAQNGSGTSRADILRQMYGISQEDENGKEETPEQ